MDYSVYSIHTVSDKKISELVKNRDSFVIEDIARLNMPEAVASIERQIESHGLKCRVYTKGRSAALAGELAIPMVGWAAALAMGVHNLATWNPDYEIAKKPYHRNLDGGIQALRREAFNPFAPSMHPS